MKPVNIFSMTRTKNSGAIQKLEKQMSKRDYFLRIKDWETDGLRQLSERLLSEDGAYDRLYFYYSFQLPKLGKEFDLLQITDDLVINIELKSGAVSEEKIRNQLLLNRQYLALLGKTVHSYTYLSDENRLVRLTKSERLSENSWEALKKDLHAFSECYTGEIEDLFREDQYLISPLTDPDRFLRRDYFLTSQQRDIRGKILKHLDEKTALFQGFTGIPGTGKTLLLYDIAMQLSRRDKVCVLHFGTFPAELRRLDQLLKRIDFLQGDVAEEQEIFQQKLSAYSAVFVDEGHRMKPELLSGLSAYAMEKKLPVIFSYDLEEAISPAERNADPATKIEKLPDYQKYRLTNRIRTNSELSSFIQTLMQPSRGFRRREFASVSVVYANNTGESELFLNDFGKNGYTLIDSEKAFCQEFDRVVMKIGPEFSYDVEGFLRAAKTEEGAESAVRTLFHGLCRARKGIALVIEDNTAVLETVLGILQGWG